MTLPLTLAENWQSFADKVINPHAPQIQRDEMKRSFHAGFVRAWELLTAEFADLPEEKAMEAMSRIEAEIIAYMRSLMDDAGIDPNQAALFTADTENPQ